IRNGLPARKGCSMMDISSASRRMPPSWRSSGTQCRSRRSSVEQDIVGTSFAKLVAARVRMSSGHGKSTLDGHLPFLDAQWTEGCRNGAELWRRLQGQGFRGSLRVVSEGTTRRRRAEKPTNQQLQKIPSVRTISRLMTTAHDNRSKAETVTIAAIVARVPTLVEARVLVESFQAMVRKKLIENLDPWIASASVSLIASFASGIIQDKPAVQAALTEPWSNGQTVSGGSAPR